MNFHIPNSYILCEPHFTGVCPGTTDVNRTIFQRCTWFLWTLSYSGDDKIDKDIRNILFNFTKVVGAAYTTKQVVLDNWEALKLLQADQGRPCRR